MGIAVRDHGIGMDPEQLGRVFHRFWRGDPARARTVGGTGLGLSIAMEDTRLHRGRLEAWAEPGGGACFRLTLPLLRTQPLDPQLPDPLPLPPDAAFAAPVAQLTATGSLALLPAPAESPAAGSPAAGPGASDGGTGPDGGDATTPSGAAAPAGTHDDGPRGAQSAGARGAVVTRERPEPGDHREGDDIG